MLADTDAGSIITAARSGAAWGYRMLLPQLLLIPILYLVQETTVRLGLITGKGHGELIRARFGPGWAYLSVGTLFLSSVGALITEFSGVGGVGLLFAIPPSLSVSVTAAFLVAVGLSGSYRRVERIGIALGAFELFFLVAAVLAHPAPRALGEGLLTIPLQRPGYLYLLAANVGAVIMPWMVFYQQGAVIDKGLGPDALGRARADTLVGAVLTQAVMLSVVLVSAAAAGHLGPRVALADVDGIVRGLTSVLGFEAARVVFGLGMLGASLTAALVVSIAGSWGVGEAFGLRHSLNDSWRRAPVFYALYTFAHVAGAALVLASRDLVTLSVDVEVMNAILLPLVLGFLLALEQKALPAQWRRRGWRKGLLWALSGLVMAFGLYTLATTV
jgi:Mn2+/Fe2+ NRAMP family transporter